LRPIYQGCRALTFALARLSCRIGLLFINFSSFKPDTENNANFDAVSSKHANFDEVQFFKTYTQAHNIWHT